MMPATLHDRYPTRMVGTVPAPFGRLDPVVWGDSPGPLSRDEVTAFTRDGYLGFRSLVSPAEAGRLLAEAERLAASEGHDRDDRFVREPDSDRVRSIFEVHCLSERFASLVADERLAGIARQILGSDVAIHQSRVNLKPGFAGKEFDWHSDFETWHAEDGLPAMRTVSISLALTTNHPHNGPLMIIPGSHRTFVPCAGETPAEHYRSSLRRQQIGVPDRHVVAELADRAGIDVLTGPPGSAVAFDCNCLHGSNSNITPFPRSNVFIVYNSVANAPVDPFDGTEPRPGFIAARHPVPV